MQLKKIFTVFLTFFFTASYANDSAGTTAAGGITFTKTPVISMVREELLINPKQVRVSYIFKNNSDKDITTQVFFPIPPLNLAALMPHGIMKLLPFKILRMFRF